MNTFASFVKQTLIEVGYAIEKINEYWCCVDEDGSVILDARQQGVLLMKLGEAFNIKDEREKV